ncbi:hypothetical protein DYB32_005880 [Aphanomyces invadans]|nr:hypothetical protein DYB32_005880 [Aphanomyces invadans]
MQFSARDLPAHKKLKTRQMGQGTVEELEGRDLKSELAERERQYQAEKDKVVDVAQQKILRLKENKLLLLKGDEWEDRAKEIQSQYDDADDDTRKDDSGSDNDSDSDDDDDSEDEEAELMRELEKIKKEREEERLKKEAADRDAEESLRKEEILLGNPLTSQQSKNPTGSATIKRKWNDDVVFKNQTRHEPETKKRFINDTIRNDFHRRFLKTYIQ